MGLLKTLDRLRAGYPGGWKRYALGAKGEVWEPFIQPTDPDDRRSRIPPLGLREYWYPALPAKDIGWKKPVGLRMLGIDLAFFRDKNGEVQALWDCCPHRNVRLSEGDCFWKGFLSCPYHGATFDGDGNCVAFITEGPDSKMVGRLRARKFPTRTVKGLVFVWMGEGEPVPIEEDVPPELFEENVTLRPVFSYFRCNWLLALENTFDAHNAFYVHRNSIQGLMGRLGGRPRTPLGYRVKIVNNKCVNYMPGRDSAPTELYYADEQGNIPYQMYYPGVDGYWPLHRWRLLWTWLTDRSGRRQAPRSRRLWETPEEWRGTRLPGMSRTALNPKRIGTRWAVPVDANLTRMVYLNCTRYERRPNLFTRIIEGATWPYTNWKSNFHFRNQDYDAERTTQYQYPEFLSSTDSVVVAIRKLITEHARGFRRTEDEIEDPAEKLVYEGDFLALQGESSIHAKRLRAELLEQTRTSLN